MLAAVVHQRGTNGVCALFRSCSHAWAQWWASTIHDLNELKRCACCAFKVLGAIAFGRPVPVVMNVGDLQKNTGKFCH